MPFTLAHPAAAVPLLRPLGRHGVLSALVIGSLVPDFWYLIPLAGRNASHGIAGLFWYCLPVGLLAYCLFHAALKRPLIALFPPATAARLAGLSAAGLPRVPWSAVTVSLLAGGATHLAWDAFTHWRGAGVQAWPALQTLLTSSGAVEVRVYHALQIVSSVLGLGLLAYWCARWLREAPPVADAGPAPGVEPAPGRPLVVVCVLLALAAITIAVGYVQIVQGLELNTSALAGALLRSVLAAGVVGLLAYGAAWHLREARRR
jgi:hypothetical protein